MDFMEEFVQRDQHRIYVRKYAGEKDQRPGRLSVREFAVLRRSVQKDQLCGALLFTKRDNSAAVCTLACNPKSKRDNRAILVQLSEFSFFFVMSAVSAPESQSMSGASALINS
jgi:hypothetical protein